ncbi:MAG: TonB-dependent receptor [Dissulfurispiraceae bacterium]
MRNRWMLLFVPMMLLSLCPEVRAEGETKLEEVVVTATRYDENTADIPANVSVITEKDIKESNAQNIPELLRKQVGVLVNDITGSGRYYTVDLRGFGETAPLNTLVLVDGRRINQADLSGVDWVLIPLEDVHRIEIVRGGQASVLYGDNAAGGVINIITKEGTSGLKAGANLAGGSYGTINGGSYVSGSMKDLSLRLSGNYLTSDGYRDNSKTEDKDANFHSTYSVRDFLKLDLSGGYHWDHTGLPGALTDSDFAAGFSRMSTQFPNDFAHTKDYYIRLVPELYFYGEDIFKIDTSFRRRDALSFNSGDWGNFTGDSVIKTIAISPQVIIKNNFGSMTNSVTSGIDFQNVDENVSDDSIFFGSESLGTFKLTEETVGFYAHDELTISKGLVFSSGYRHEIAHYSFDPSTPGTSDMSTDSYTAGINYTYFKQSYVYASFSKSFRFPVLDELYSYITNTINTYLLPQTAKNYEIGIKHDFNDVFSAHLNVFKIDTDREIIYNPVLYENENLDGMTQREGAEVSLEAKATEWLTLRGGYTFQTAKIEGGMFQGSDVPNVPQHKATIDVVCHITKQADAILNGIYVGERRFISDWSNDFSNQDAYVLLNAKFNYRWKSVKAFLNLNNLTNKKYAEYGVIGGVPLQRAYYPSPTRNFLVGLSIDI